MCKKLAPLFWILVFLYSFFSVFLFVMFILYENPMNTAVMHHDIRHLILENSTPKDGKPSDINEALDLINIFREIYINTNRLLLANAIGSFILLLISACNTWRVLFPKKNI